MSGVLQRTLAILERLAANISGISLATLADELQMPRSAAHRLLLELTEEAPSAEHLDNQVQKAQEQLLQLKRQQEQIEKQKRELEELSRRQDELEQGRGEMTDKLTRALVVLEREAYNAQSRLEQIRVARESFAQHLEVVEAIDPSESPDLTL